MNLSRRVVITLYLAIVLVGTVSGGYTVAYPAAAPAGGNPQEITPLEWWEIPAKTYLMFLAISICPGIVSSLEVLNSIYILTVLGLRRLTGKDALQHPVRTEAYEYICKNPGSGFSKIAKDTGVNRGTLRYHLNILIRQNRVLEKKVYGFVSYFQNNKKYTKFEQDFLMLAREGISKDICLTLASSPGATRNELATELEVTPPTISWHMNRLIEQEIVTYKREKKTVSYYLSGEALAMINSGVKSADSDMCNPAITHNMHLYETS